MTVTESSGSREFSPTSSAGLALPGIGPRSFVIVTGGAGVLGSAVAGALTSLGATVGLVGRSSTSLQRRAEACPGPGRALWATGDVAERGSVAAAVTDLVERAGPPTGLVNMAAVIAGSRRSSEVSEEEIDVLLRVNVKGSFEAVQACAPAMAEAGGGSVVLVSSVAAHRARSGAPLYGATKAAVIRLTQQLAWEHGPSGIRVNCISPGQTPTELTPWDAAPSSAPPAAKVTAGVEADSSSAVRKVARLPLRRRGTPSDYAGPVLFLLSDLAAYVTGVDVPVDGGLVATL